MDGAGTHTLLHRKTIILIFQEVKDCSFSINLTTYGIFFYFISI
jgi:hypothetical protein